MRDLPLSSALNLHVVRILVSGWDLDCLLGRVFLPVAPSWSYGACRLHDLRLSVRIGPAVAASSMSDLLNG